MTWHNSGKAPEIEHDAQSSRRYKEDLDDLWPRIKALEIELSRLQQVRDAVLDCEGVEMRDCYKVPKDQWEAVISFAVDSVMDEASNALSPPSR